MKIRTTAPTTDNKYYITKKAGGWSPCIEGNAPKFAGSVLKNCVGYGVGRFNEIGGYNKIKYLGNLYPRAMIAAAKAQGLTVQKEPVAGGLMIWTGSKEHCAIAEKISGTKVKTSESGWNSTKYFYNLTRTGSNYGLSTKYYKYQGCIVNPAVDPYGVPSSKYLKYGMTGEGVKWLQWALIKEGAKISLDGKFGPKTRDALKAFQTAYNLTADGIAGPKTQAIIKEKYSII